MPRTTIRTEDITASEVTTAKMAVDPTNASNLSSGSVPLAQLGNVDTSQITANQDDIALLGFKVAANGSLARYNLVDQFIDAFEDASGVDASASTNETRNASNYYAGTGTADTFAAFTTVETTTWTAPAGLTQAEVLVVGGGGGATGTTTNGLKGGGGGAGGIVHDTDYPITAGTVYDLSVGGGGAGTAYGTTASNGTDTVWNINAEASGLALTAKGGGYGNSYNGSGGSGGSGGGAAGSGSGGASNQASFTGATSYGYAGGSGSGNMQGGGGGAGGVGSTNPPGVAGDGREFTTFVAYGTDTNNVASTGANGGWFGGGGGGAAASSEDGARGGGGDGGGTGQTPANGTNGLANTGGGGGGSYTGSSGSSSGGSGGSGGIFINYSLTTYNDMTLVSNAQTAQDGAPTTGDLVITYTDGAGTATVNTDIKAYISRDGSAYTSAVTLVAQGTTGGHTILTANGVDLSGIATGTSMRWKIETLNQSVSKQTRIQAVSLGWS